MKGAAAFGLGGGLSHCSEGCWEKLEGSYQIRDESTLEPRDNQLEPPPTPRATSETTKTIAFPFRTTNVQTKELPNHRKIISSQKNNMYGPKYLQGVSKATVRATGIANEYLHPRSECRQGGSRMPTIERTEKRKRKEESRGAGDVKIW